MTGRVVTQAELVARGIAAAIESRRLDDAALAVELLAQECASVLAEIDRARGYTRSTAEIIAAQARMVAALKGFAGAGTPAKAPGGMVPLGVPTYADECNCEQALALKARVALLESSIAALADARAVLNGGA